MVYEVFRVGADDEAVCVAKFSTREEADAWIGQQTDRDDFTYVVDKYDEGGG